MKSTWHSLSDEEVINNLNSNKDGLSTEEVAKRQIQYGKNVLPKEKEPTLLNIFVSQFKSPMIIILIIAGVIAAAMRNYKDSFFIIIVLILNAILGTYQEYSAIKSASSIQKLLKITAKTLRDGKKIEIDSEDLVPGDIIILESGDKVPADIRLIESHSLKVDESFLTGESEGVDKNSNISKPDAPITDRLNMCYASSAVQYGRAIGIVVATGISTEIGNIAQDLVKTKEAKSPLTMRMETFTKHIMYLVFVFAVLTSALMVMEGYQNREIFLLVIAMCVSAIPEGLPIAQTVVLSIATSRMVKRNVIVKKLSSVESLGSCTVIASDKTGTLTVNQQTAKVISLPDKTEFEISGEGYNDIGLIKLKDANENTKLNPEQDLQIDYLCKIGVLNTEAFLDFKDDQFIYHGDSIDLAFLSLGLKYGINKKNVDQEFNILGRIPYESENKFSAVFFEHESEKHIAVKGSAETILSFCVNQKSNNEDVPIDREQLEEEFLRLSADGYRVIALASGKYPGEIKTPFSVSDVENLTFIGFVGFIDPIRNTSKDAIQKCHKAGIRVIMITGDHPLTAKSIAKDLNLLKGSRDVITGETIETTFNTSRKALVDLVTKNDVFARVSPLQKAIIVETLRELGEFVAVTGDGINDAPALKKANIGVAMGSGTDVAKDVSPMIITDDNFSSIVSAVEEGRHAYNNVRKVIYLLISTAFAEMLLFATSIIFHLPPPFTTVQILWINLATNGIQDIAIACEKGEKSVMDEKPRATNERIFDKLLTRETIISALTIFLMVFVLWYMLNDRAGRHLVGTALDEARNYILLLMILLQNVHTFNCRSEKVSAFKIPLRNNRFIVYAVLGALILHVTCMNIPLIQSLLIINPVTIRDFLITLAMALPLLFVMEIFKASNKRKVAKAAKS